MQSSIPHETIRVSVRLFSVLRHRDGRIVDRLEIELPQGSRAGDVLHVLKVDEALESALSLNSILAEPETVLSDGDVLAIIPAVAGG